MERTLLFFCKEGKVTGLADAMTILSTSVNASLMLIRKKRDRNKTQTGSFGKEVVAADVMA